MSDVQVKDSFTELGKCSYASLATLYVTDSDGNVISTLTQQPPADAVCETTDYLNPLSATGNDGIINIASQHENTEAYVNKLTRKFVMDKKDYTDQRVYVQLENFLSYTIDTYTVSLYDNETLKETIYSGTTMKMGDKTEISFINDYGVSKPVIMVEFEYSESTYVFKAPTSWATLPVGIYYTASVSSAPIYACKIQKSNGAWIIPTVSLEIFTTIMRQNGGRTSTMVIDTKRPYNGAFAGGGQFINASDKENWTNLLALLPDMTEKYGYGGTSNAYADCVTTLTGLSTTEFNTLSGEWVRENVSVASNALDVTKEDLLQGYSVTQWKLYKGKAHELA